jgi:phosphatidylserine synthase
MIYISYTVVTFAFFPLFISIMTLFKVIHPDIYERIRVRTTLIFLVFIGFLMIRLYLYIDLKSLHVIFSTPTVYAVIPFYITEVIIAISLSYVLYITGQMERHKSGGLPSHESEKSEDLFKNNQHI